MGSSTKYQANHLGRKISRIRELHGIKQGTLAADLEISQQAISKIEQSETIEEGTLNRVAKALGLRKEAIENFNDEVIYSCFNTLGNNETGIDNNNSNIYRLLDKIIELYERLLLPNIERLWNNFFQNTVKKQNL